ncbi:MAG: Uma2 family endonuclease [Deltaproteobacteria bacterium]|nr:Uma2 family endonuclease [Deltaproteobacteria bacterium]
MAPKPHARPATYAELERLPEHLVGELLGGELVVSPRPAPAHARAASILGAELTGPFDRKPGEPGGPGGWWLLDEPELHLQGDVVVPDLAGWRRARMPRLPKGPAFELAPDWACEVISPSTARFDRSRKLPIYAREQVAHVWLIDPLARTLEVFRLEAGRYVLLETFGEQAPERVHAEPFETYGLELGRLWLEPDPEDANRTG